MILNIGTNTYEQWKESINNLIDSRQGKGVPNDTTLTSYQKDTIKEKNIKNATKAYKSIKKVTLIGVVEDVTYRFNDYKKEGVFEISLKEVETLESVSGDHVAKNLVSRTFFKSLAGKLRVGDRVICSGEVSQNESTSLSLNNVQVQLETDSDNAL